jgi:hypothetical protein
MDLLEYNQLVNYLNTLQLPENLTVKEQQKFRNKVKHYFMKNQTLYRRNNRNPEQPLKVIKITEIEEILFNEHSAIHTGHFGIEVTYHRISQNYYWPNLYKDIENYIKACDVCQRKGKLRKNNSLHPIETKPPFEKIGIDLVGPLSLTSNNNRYIVVAIDYGTK